MTGFAMNSRLKLVGWQAAFSFVCLAVIFFLVFFMWYPPPLANALGVSRLYGLLLVVHLIFGPALAFFVYKSDRKKLILDLLAIFLLQSVACAYGLFIIFQGRPAWLVFVVDDFEVVRTVDVDSKSLEKINSEFSSSIFDGPKMAAAVYSENKEIQLGQKQDELISGKSFARKVEAYQLLPKQKKKMQESARALEELEKFNSKDAVSAARRKWHTATSWLPLKGGQRDMTVLLDREGAVVAITDLSPWD